MKVIFDAPAILFWIGMALLLWADWRVAIGCALVSLSVCFVVSRPPRPRRRDVFVEEEFDDGA